eukprot:TRINITY_DN7874_c0_g1_i1.p1 TRINITY_DN7874_c0_g1~~TRINITY_DN7874_c0_g1_i1.p1  ORF type:complete len:925 (+),score=99.71 TRINITY_DN7874_c0_g1_i1:38-2776(+)
MVSWRFVAVTACYFFLAHGIRLDGPIHANDLMQHNVDQCLTGQIVRDTTFISTTLAALRPEGDKIIKRNKEDVVRDWHHVQTEAATWLQDTDESARKVRESNPPHVLIAQAVKGADVTINRVKANMEHLLRSKYGVFKWAFFHYDGRDMWEHYDWYNASPDIVRREIIPVGGCEESHYRRLSVKDTHDFDYIWLMDDDIDLTFLDWDLYATVLASSQSMISQPAILSGSFTGRTSDVPGLTMVPASNGELLIMSETHTSEVMTPLISTKLWPAIQARLLSKVTKCDSDINMFWDLVAFLGRIYCNYSAITVLNAAPASHVDCRDMPNVGSCFSGCEGDLSRPVSMFEAELALATCKNIPPDWSQRYGCDAKPLTECAAVIRSAAFAVQPKVLRLRIKSPQLVEPPPQSPSVTSSQPGDLASELFGVAPQPSGTSSIKGDPMEQNVSRVPAQSVATAKGAGQLSGAASPFPGAGITEEPTLPTGQDFTPISTSDAESIESASPGLELLRGLVDKLRGIPSQSSVNTGSQNVTTPGGSGSPGQNLGVASQSAGDASHSSENIAPTEVGEAIDFRQDDFDAEAISREIELIRDLRELLPRVYSEFNGTNGARQVSIEPSTTTNVVVKGAQTAGTASKSLESVRRPGGVSGVRQDDANLGILTPLERGTTRGLQGDSPNGGSQAIGNNATRQYVTAPSTTLAVPAQSVGVVSQSLQNGSPPQMTRGVGHSDVDPTPSSPGAHELPGLPPDHANLSSREAALVRGLHDLILGAATRSQGTKGVRPDITQQLRTAMVIADQLKAAISARVAAAPAPTLGGSQSMGMSQSGTNIVRQNVTDQSRTSNTGGIGARGPSPKLEALSESPDSSLSSVTEANQDNESFSMASISHDLEVVNSLQEMLRKSEGATTPDPCPEDQ